MEEWERTLCENKAVAILEQIQEGRPALIQRDGRDMLIAMVLDRPLMEALELGEDPEAFFEEKIEYLSRNATIWSRQLQEKTHHRRKLRQAVLTYRIALLPLGRDSSNNYITTYNTHYATNTYQMTESLATVGYPSLAC